MAHTNQDSVIEFLSRADSYAGFLAAHGGGGVAALERRETHISIIFLIGEHAFKLKRAVKYPYLDFSTLEQRRTLCEHEVEINRRTAPDLYRGTIAVSRATDGGLELGGNGEVVEWLVWMRRFDDTKLWSTLIECGTLERHDAELLADQVARFHAARTAQTDIDSVAGLRTTIDANEQSMLPHVDSVFNADQVAALFTQTRAALERAVPALSAHAEAGGVRACHGDLHLGNIFMGDDGPVVFDAIEFNDTFVMIDVLYDLSFLLMDMDFHGRGDFATVVLNRYLDHTGDVSAIETLPLLMTLRACIRAHVSATAASRHADPDAAQTLRVHAVQYLNLALGYLQPITPRLLCVGGLSGSGKSHMARVLAAELGGAPGARVVRSDTTRKRLAGVGFEDNLPAQSYTAQASVDVYTVCLNEARTVLERGFPVVLDAVFAQPEERAAAEVLAHEAGVRFDGVWLEAPIEVMQSRVGERQHNASDATADVVIAQTCYNIGEMRWQRIDSSGTREESRELGLRVIAYRDLPGVKVTP